MSVRKLWVTFCVLCSITPGAAYAQEFAVSQASNNESETFGTRSGWVNQKEWYTSGPPTGNWDDNYKHWFGIGGEPGAYTTFKTYAKPPAATWGNPTYKDDKTSTSAGGSEAKSEWVIDPYTRKAAVFFGAREYWAKYSTYSFANAKKGSKDKLANSKTEIADPWTVFSPQADPTFSLSGLPLDPSGKWTLSGEVNLWGTLSTNDGSTSMNWSYAVAPNSSDPAAAIHLLDITITGQQATVTANQSLLNSGDFTITDVNQNPLTVSDIEDLLNSYRTSSGWSLNPSQSLDTFEPDTQDSDVFSLDMYLKEDSSTSFVTIFTDRSATATAATPVPEASSVVSFGAMLLLGTGVMLRARKRRAVGA